MMRQLKKVYPWILITLIWVLTACAGNVEHSDASAKSTGETAMSEKHAWERAAKERKQTGKFDTPQCSGVIAPDQEGFNKRIALTFDDGPNPSTTPRVLEILQEHDAKGTFFVQGTKIEAHPETFQSIIDAGHLVGNHSTTHSNLSNMSRSGVETELGQTHSAITELGTTPKYMRFPYGAADCEAIDVAENYGYRVTGWHIDSADWCFEKSAGGTGYCAESTFESLPAAYRDDMTSYVVSQARRTNGGILLFHDTKNFTVTKLDEILTRLKREGFTFVGLDNEETFPNLNSPPQRVAWTGTPCGESSPTDDSAVCDYSPNASCLQFSAENTEDENDDETTVHGFCTTKCEGYCDDKAGKATTFCVKREGWGTGHCVPKAAPENSHCREIPGTAPRYAARYVGDSRVPEHGDTVCLPAIR